MVVIMIPEVPSQILPQGSCFVVYSSGLKTCQSYIMRTVSVMSSVFIEHMMPGEYQPHLILNFIKTLVMDMNNISSHCHWSVGLWTRPTTITTTKDLRNM